MAEDARPSSSHNPLPSRHLPPAPPASSSAAAAGAWWTRPMPTADAPRADPGQASRYPAPGPAGPAPVQPWSASTPPGPGHPGTPLPGGNRSARQASNVRGHRRAWVILGLVGGAPLLATLAVVSLLPDPPPASQAGVAAVPSRPQQTVASRSSREATPVTPSLTPTRPPEEPADLTELPADVAGSALRRAGVTVDGTVSVAWGWTDDRGRNLVAAVREVTSRADDGSSTGVGLRVYYLTGLEGHPVVQRKVKDPSLHCSHHGTVTAGFTRPAFGVRDLDGDGSPEIMVGWTARCGDPGTSSRIRLAVMSGGRLYMLRGTGVVTGQAAGADATGPGATDPGATDPPGATDLSPHPGEDPDRAETPNGSASAPITVPSASQWPSALLDAALAAFHRLYY